MHFCSVCHNMYYLKIRDEDGGNTLNYYCRNCGHEDTTLTAETICVSETQLRRSEQKYTHMINEYTKFDPTLPRINTIKCPNQECSSNGGTMHEGGTMHGGTEDTTNITLNSENNVEQDGGAGKKKTEAALEEEAQEKKTVTTAAARKNKTAKTLAKEEAEQAKDDKETAKKIATAAKKILAEEEKEIEEEQAQAQSLASAKSKTTHTKKKENDREVIYIRYDDINMKYVYLCVHCDTTWKTDNRL